MPVILKTAVSIFKSHEKASEVSVNDVNVKMVAVLKLGGAFASASMQATEGVVSAIYVFEGRLEAT